MSWLQTTLQTYPEIAVFIALAFGYWLGNKTLKGFSLGTVTSTLIFAVIIGQLNIHISGDVKNIFFLMFLFAVGYGIGPQFVRGLANDGLSQALFAVVQCIFCLIFPIIAAKIAGYNSGIAAGLYAGSQTISAAMGLSSSAITKLHDPHMQSILNAMPVAYAVVYIFGTVGSAFILAELGPKILRINLAQACKDYEQTLQTSNTQSPSASLRWHQYELRSYQLLKINPAIDYTISNLENKLNHQVFIEAIKRNQQLLTVRPTTTLQPNDIITLGGDHKALIDFFGHDKHLVECDEVDIPLNINKGIDVYITNKIINNKTLEEIGEMPDIHGVFITKIKRGALGTEIPVLPQTRLHSGDVITLTGLTQDIERVIKFTGEADRQTNTSDVTFLASAIAIGALIGAITLKIGNIPLTLSTAGGSLIAGLVFGWLRSIHPTFGRIPESTVWFMNSVGLNVFIAVVGITAGPSFITGLKMLGINIFLWGIFATSLPLICGMLVGKYIFKFHPAIILGCCAGARTTTAALGMVCDKAQSNIPSLGYTITYAVGNTLLTIWGMVIIMFI